MSYQDRYYYRDSQSDRSNPLSWLLSGSIPVASLAGTRLRLHASLLVFVALTLLLGGPAPYTLAHRAVSMAMLVAVVCLHEFAHALMTRWLGGHAHEIIVWPIGGLSEFQPPRRPFSAFLSALAGPITCLMLGTIALIVLRSVYGISAPQSPTANLLAPADPSQFSFYLWYLYVVSGALLLFNLLPIYPLAGGHLIQALLWPALGFGRSMVRASELGLIATVPTMFYGVYSGEWLVIVAMVFCAIYCIQKRMVLKSAANAGFEDYEDDTRPRRHHLSRFTKWRARRQIRLEEAETMRVDSILSKVSLTGLASLTWREKRALRRATERQRERDMEDLPQAHHA